MELPKDFKTYIVESLGDENASTLIKAIEKGEKITSIRLNPFKPNKDIFKEQDCIKQVSWSKDGYYLPQRILFTLDPVFHAGGYYVQEASSMYMNLVFDAINKIDSNFIKKELNVLDLCAAPGGKSTHILSLLNKNSILISNEVIKSRATILSENIAKWGVDNAIVTNNDPSDFTIFKNFFDIIIVDAPCSGEGLFRKDPKAIEQWSKENVELCSKRQKRILSDIWDTLKPNGFLIYSTCTYNKYENDENINFIKTELGADIITLNNPENSEILQTKAGGLQFVAGKIYGEGQFIGLLQKHNGNLSINKHKKNKPVTIDNCNFLPDNYIKTLNGSLVKAYRKDLFERIRFIEDNLKIILSGIAIAEKKGKDYIPHADLALSCNFLNYIQNGLIDKKIAEFKIDKETALKFLAKEAIILSKAPLGYILLTYNNLGIGFLKNLGNRTNNLHPMSRRIRMDIK